MPQTNKPIILLIFSNSVELYDNALITTLQIQMFSNDLLGASERVFGDAGVVAEVPLVGQPAQHQSVARRRLLVLHPHLRVRRQLQVLLEPADLERR